MKHRDIRVVRAAGPLRVFVATRALVWLVAIYAWLWFIPHHIGSAPHDLGYVTELWSRFDSGWFVDIARHGYRHNGNEVFYPLYPLLIAGLGRAFGGYYIAAGIVISLACGAAAFVLLHRLALQKLSRDGAMRALVYVAVFPMSLYLQAVYSESLFLLCAVAAFLAAERGKFLTAAVAVGLATLTRIVGVALFPAIVIFAWRSPERRRALLSLTAAPALAALYPLWLQLRLHAIFSEFSNEAGWRRHLSHAGPLGGLWRSMRASWTGIEQLVTGDEVHAQYAAVRNLEDLVFFVVFAILGVLAWRRFGAPYGVYVLGSLALAASVPQDSYPLLSMPRFCLTLFPAFLVLAAWATSAARDRLVVVASSLFLAVAVVQWSTGYWVS